MGCILQIGVVGINYKIADLSFRESIARAAAGLSGEKSLFFPHPIILLSTCNRTEIYFGGADLATSHVDLLSYLRKQIGEPFEHRLYSYFGLDCFAHLGRVTAGLDSAIIAETEIQRQVKTAYVKSCEFSTLTSSMHYAFQKSLKLGKFVRSQFEIDRKAPTLFHAIWQLASEKLGPLAAKRILLIGHSDLNRGIAFSLEKKGIKSFSLVTKNPAAVRLPGCTAHPRSELERWQEYDLLICAASSDSYLISGQSNRLQVVFDLSVPRNIDPQIAANPKITLYNIEELNTWIEKKRDWQSAQTSFCNELVTKQTHLFARAYRHKNLFRDQLATL
jgi:glutamyl-tRNA reductase